MCHVTMEKIYTAFVIFLVIFLVIWVVTFVVLFALSNEASNYNIYVQDVYIPALDISTSNGTTTSFNTSILVDLKYKRRLAIFSLDYKDRELVLHYAHGIIPVAGYLVRAFSMGHHITVVHKMAAMEAPQLPWDKAFRAVSEGSTVELVVKLGNLHRFVSAGALAADVAVGASGHMVSKGPIKLVENG